MQVVLQVSSRRRPQTCLKGKPAGLDPGWCQPGGSNTPRQLSQLVAQPGPASEGDPSPTQEPTSRFRPVTEPSSFRPSLPLLLRSSPILELISLPSLPQQQILSSRLRADTQTPFERLGPSPPWAETGKAHLAPNTEPPGINPVGDASARRGWESTTAGRALRPRSKKNW